MTFENVMGVVVALILLLAIVAAFTGNWPIAIFSAILWHGLSNNDGHYNTIQALKK